MSDTLTATYDRKTRTYTAHAPGGLVLAGRTRQEVELAYLDAVAPAIARKVRTVAERWPALADRARRAGLLVVAQAVRPGRGLVAEARPWHPTVWFQETAQVRGSGYAEDRAGRVVGRDWYSVTVHGDGYRCNCLDWQEGSAPAAGDSLGRVCKHILAATLSGLY